MSTPGRPLTSIVAPARAARSDLSRALESLQRLAPPHPAVEHLANASNALYRAEIEATTRQAVVQGIHSAAAELEQALVLLQPAPTGSLPGDARTLVAEVLLKLGPVVRATRRPRREVVMLRDVPDDDRRQLRARRRSPSIRPRQPSFDRRLSASRTTLRLDVGLSSDTHYYAGVSANLSRGGLFLICDQPLPKGTAVTVRFVLPNGHSVVADGVIRWARESGSSVPGMGLGFSRLAAEDLRQIAAYCDDSVG